MAVQNAAMTATEGAPVSALRRPARSLVAAIGFVSLMGAGLTFYFYQQHASIWLRSPPRMHPCVLVSRRLLMHEEPVSGSVPYMAADGSMVYLRPAEDRAVRCVGRVSSGIATALATAFAEVDPDKRAKALAAVLREQIPADASADNEALAAYLLINSAFRALPKTPEIEALKAETDERNACRFALRTPCPSRPPIPMRVWVAGVPSSIGLVIGLVMGLGWAVTGLVARVRAWREKRRAAKKFPENKPAAETPEREEAST